MSLILWLYPTLIWTSHFCCSNCFLRWKKRKRTLTLLTEVFTPSSRVEFLLTLDYLGLEQGLMLTGCFQHHSLHLSDPEPSPVALHNQGSCVLWWSNLLPLGLGSSSPSSVFSHWSIHSKGLLLWTPMVYSLFPTTWCVMFFGLFCFLLFCSVFLLCESCLWTVK